MINKWPAGQRMHALRAPAVLAFIFVLTACAHERACHCAERGATSSEATKSGLTTQVFEESRKQAEGISALAAAVAAKGKLVVETKNGEREFALDEWLPRQSLRRVKTLDPYYSAVKEFYAVLLLDLLKEVWPELKRDSSQMIELEASDGYKVRLPFAQILADAPLLAFYDLGRPPFEPISERKADPAPLYLIWEGNDLDNLETHPRPWSIQRVRRIAAGQGLDHIRPRDGFGDDGDAEKGATLFEQQCLRCHSINQEGGKLGPDLNIPQNILEYRSEAKVRAYIKDPRTFRYGNMPSHSHLDEQDLSQLISYLRVMKDHKFDPQRSKETEAVQP